MKKNLLPFFLLFFLSPISLLAQEKSREEEDLKRVEKIQSNLAQIIQTATQAYLSMDGGSAVIFSPSGEVLTNHHVVANRKVGESWYVMDLHKKILLIQLLAVDVWGDLAYLKIHSSSPTPFIPMAPDHSLKTGDPVIALGNPFSLALDGRPSASLGIVSALEMQEYNYSLAIQTDTPINPGNSGGPLLNFKGELVGINGKITPRFFKGINSGVGFAIPVEQLKRFLPPFRKGGRVYHGNIDGIILEPDLVQRRIQKVIPESSAQKANLKEGDEILSVDGSLIRHQAHFWGLLQSYPEGALVKLKIKRQEGILEISLSLDRYTPPELSSEEKKPFLGVRLGEASSFRGKPALPVEEVAPDSPAEKAGLQLGDLILSVDGKNFSSPQEFGKYIREKKPESEITLVLQRGKKVFSLTLRLGSL